MSGIRQVAIVRLLFFLTSTGLLFFAIAKIDNLLVSLILAIVNAYVLYPAADYFERRGLSRSASVAIPFFTQVLSLILLGVIFIPDLLDQAQGIEKNFPQYLESTNLFVSRVEGSLANALKGVYSIDSKTQLEPYLLSWGQQVFQDLPHYLSKSLMVAFLTPLLSFFILLDGRRFMKNLLSIVPNKYFELTLNLQYQIASQVGGFIRARAVQSALVALVIWLGLVIMGFPYALVLALFAGILNVIPYLGPLIGVLPALIVSFSNVGWGEEMLWISFIYGLAQVVDMAVITPFVVAKIVNLHPVTVILVIIVGSQTMGVLGMIIGIPLYSALKVSFVSIYKHLTDFRT